jgi:uridine phosphorylase
MADSSTANRKHLPVESTGDPGSNEMSRVHVAGEREFSHLSGARRFYSLCVGVTSTGVGMPSVGVALGDGVKVGSGAAVGKTSVGKGVGSSDC